MLFTLTFLFFGTEKERVFATTEMATRNLEKMASIDAQLRLLAPGKVSEDDKLVEYDALLLDRFLDILNDLHGEEIRETVSCFYLYWFSLPSILFVGDLCL